MVRPTDAELRVSGGLTGTFIHCDTCLSDDDFNFFRHKEFIKEELHVFNGLVGGSVTNVIDRGSVASNNQSKHVEKRKAEQRRKARFAELVEQIRTSIEQMEADIKALEELFQKRDGDAWREKLALKILGEDDIPQQEPGEDISAYRKRLETHLINEMLNTDGSIKAKYKNHPELSDYAEWAQRQFHLNNARAIATELDDVNTSPQRREQILDEMEKRSNDEEMMLTDRESKSVDTQSSVRDVRDNQHDKVLSQARSSDVAVKFTS